MGNPASGHTPGADPGVEPTLDPASALRRIAHAGTIVLLDAGADGCSYLSWGEHLEPVPWMPGTDLASGLDALVPRAAPQEMPAASHPGWSDFTGGAFLQLDYESPQTPPRAWRCRGWACWRPGQGWQLHGEAEHCERMRRELAGAEAPCPPPRLLGALQALVPREMHRRMVEHIREQIAQGTLYQVNLTLPFIARHDGYPHGDIGAFLALRALSPAPFAAFIRGPGRPSVVSHSPECFLRARGAELTAMPIKGTRRREPGREPAVRSQLLASAKDRAELTMIIDLTRNDLGRVSVPGSVQVREAARLLDLSYAHHLMGVVTARLPPPCGYGSAIAHAFPAGSITGAPKLQAMTMLRAIEDRPRGAYCGCFGWLGPQGCDLAVAIRTMVIDDATVQVHAGGGIVADSDPAAEWDEVHTKATTMLQALGSP